MPTQLNIKLTSQDGVTLNTEGKYCDKDIVVVPQLEDKVVKPTTEKQTITPSSGYAGIRSVEIEAADISNIEPLNITNNGTYTAPEGIGGYSPITVNVQPALQEKTMAKNGEVLPDTGYYGLSRVEVALPEYSGDYMVIEEDE